MITFSCQRCSTSYTVTDDKGGKRTTCPKCGMRLAVPLVRRRRWRTILLVTLPVIAAVALVILLRPNPTLQEVESALHQNLPPGYEKLDVREYDRAEGKLRLAVTYREHAGVGVDYEAVRVRTYVPSGREWVVSVTGRRPQWDQPDPFERWLVVDASFDRKGKMVRKKPGVGIPAFEERAAQIAVAVHAAF